MNNSNKNTKQPIIHDITQSKSTRSVLVELQFLPSLYYLANLISYESLILEQHENYNKGSFRNKCVVSNNQQNQYLIIPLKKGKHNSKSIREVKIAYDMDWIRVMNNRLKTEYGKYPYYDYYIGDIMAIVNQRLENLFYLNAALLEYIFHILDIKDYNYSNKYETKPTSDLLDQRDTITPEFIKKTPGLLSPTQEGYFSFIPGHSFLEPLFAYGPEVSLLINQYSQRIKNESLIS